MVIGRLAYGIAVLLLLVRPVAAGIDEASRAYGRGEYMAAAAELTPLARAGNPRAQFLLGRMTFYGHALPQDTAVAADWYRRAAEQGYAPAQLAFALALDNGWGVLQDRPGAVKWYRLAALQGEEPAMWRLAYHYRRGGAVARDLVLAWAWYDVLAVLGDGQAASERDWISLLGIRDDEITTARGVSIELQRLISGDDR